MVVIRSHRVVAGIVVEVEHQIVGAGSYPYPLAVVRNHLPFDLEAFILTLAFGHTFAAVEVTTGSHRVVRILVERRTFHLEVVAIRIQLNLVVVVGILPLVVQIAAVLVVHIVGIMLQFSLSFENLGS